MDIKLIIFLCLVLFLLFITYNILLERNEKTKKATEQEIKKNEIIIKQTEDVINFSNIVPFSQTLYLTLYKRILNSVTKIQELKDGNLENDQILGLKNNIENLKNINQFNKHVKFRTPQNDNQAIVMLKVIKKIKSVIKSEHNKGSLTTNEYIKESQRLEELQLRINIENALKRAELAMSGSDHGTSMHLLNKSLDYIGIREDEYSLKAKDKIEGLINNIVKIKKAKDKEDLQKRLEQEADDDFNMFEKKKW